MDHENSSDLVIVGASGFGKEVAWLSRRLGLNVKGFLDDGIEPGSIVFNYPVLGRILDWPEYSFCKFVIAIASPRVRKIVVEKMSQVRSPDFATLVDPAAILEDDSLDIGPGTIVCAGTICTADIVIGSHCIVNKACSIGHDVKIGEFVTISPKVMLGGSVLIEHGVEIGAMTAVQQGVKVSQGAMIGMGSVIRKNLPANTLVVGNPPKTLRKLKEF
ncbi:acetyltransferase [Halomonas marinisediminis]|uniref:Acetyltransferase n=1 Tax=Halomonas marinisediminis TaxID=2546095 RepID=A0ABY2D781_9GAMM|nr:acetyltransferase [Halomonas marinisediminis]TDB02880.1 acetyltransferase [Halomonas marinisediminis]